MPDRHVVERQSFFGHHLESAVFNTIKIKTYCTHHRMNLLQELLGIRERTDKKIVISSSSDVLLSTAIGLRKYRIPFDLRS